MFVNLFRNVVITCGKRAAASVPLTGNIESNARLAAVASGNVLSRSLHILLGANPAVNLQLMSVPKLLTPTASPQLMQTCGFKVKGRLKRRCRDCYFVMREGRLFNLCPTHPRHKQMGIKVHPRVNWIVTHATQSKVRPW